MKNQEIVYKSVKQLIPYTRNSRRHSEKQIELICKLIQEYGWTNPVLIDGENGIIAGHCRVIAAKKLKLEQVPCIELKHFSDAQKKAYIIADNKSAESESEFDDELLAMEFDDLAAMNFDLNLTGFDEDELKKIIDLPEELVEKEKTLSFIKKTRILISIDTDMIPDIEEILENIKKSGAEIDFSGN